MTTGLKMYRVQIEVRKPSLLMDGRWRLRVYRTAASSASMADRQVRQRLLATGREVRYTSRINEE